MSAIKLRDIISSLGNIICYCRQAFSLFLTKHEAKSRTIMDLAQEIDVKYKLFVITITKRIFITISELRENNVTIRQPNQAYVPREIR